MEKPTMPAQPSRISPTRFLQPEDFLRTGWLDELESSFANGSESGLAQEVLLERAREILETFLAENHLGVDCSGFSMRVTLQDPDIAEGWAQRHPNLSQDEIVWDAASVGLMESKGHSGQQNSEKLPVSAARSGDLVLNSSSSHVGVVEVNPTQVTVAELLETEGLSWRSNSDKRNLAPDTKVWKVGIAHSVDSSSSSISNDLPGPHLGTYYFLDDGRRIAWEEVAESMSSFTEFRRPMVYPASANGSTS